MRTKIIIDKETCTLIINNPEKDDGDTWKCVANGVPTECVLTVEGGFSVVQIDSFLHYSEPPVIFNWIEELTPETDITRTKEGQFCVKLNSGRANITWFHKGKEITVRIV
jgi:hypothetical protein